MSESSERNDCFGRFPVFAKQERRVWLPINLLKWRNFTKTAQSNCWRQAGLTDGLISTLQLPPMETVVAAKTPSD